MNNTYLDSKKRKLIKLEDKWGALDTEKNDLHIEKDLANAHRLALVKKENNQPLTEEDLNAISDVKNTFPEFFEEEVEGSDPETETTPEYKERKQVAEIVQYLKEELKSNKNKMGIIAKQYKETEKIISTIENANPVSKSSASVIAESSTSASVIADPSVSASVTAEISEDNKLTTKSEQGNKGQSSNTNDFIDNLPTEYNPFDDVGND